MYKVIRTNWRKLEDELAKLKDDSLVQIVVVGSEVAIITKEVKVVKAKGTKASKGK